MKLTRVSLGVLSALAFAGSAFSLPPQNSTGTPPECACGTTGANGLIATAPRCGTGMALACNCGTQKMACVDPTIFNIPTPIFKKIIAGPPPPPPKPPQ